MKRGLMFNRRIKKSNAIFLFLGVSMLFSSALTFPAQTNAQSCPVYYSFSQQFPRPGYIVYNTSDIDTRDRIGFSHTFSEGGYSVTIDSKVSMRTAIFSEIFLNFYNMVGAFTTADAVNDPQYEDRWKTLCINRDGTAKGKVTIDATGVIRYLKTTTRTLNNGESIPPSASSCDNVTPNGTVDDGETCNVDEEKPTDSSPIDDSDTQNFSVPYPNGIREIARKIPSIINVTNRYCIPNDPTTFCSAGFTCKEIPPEALSLYPDIGSFTGVCSVDSSNLASGGLPFPANLLCSEENITAPSTTLPSKVCYDQPSSDPIFTQQQHVPPESTDFTDPPELPFLKTMAVHEPTNEVPFDTVAAEDYFANALTNRLGVYTPQEAEWMRNLPGQVIFSQSVQSGTTKIKGPWSSDDFIDKLGGYAEMAQDSRFMNPDLIPIGAQAVTAGGHTAYLRGKHGYEGALFVDGLPMGIGLDVAQRLPFIYERNGDLAVAVVAAKNANNKKGLYVATTARNSTALSPLIKIGEGDFWGSPAVFPLRNGEKIAFGTIGGVYKYFLSSGGQFVENTPPRTLLNNEIDAGARFAIDDEDNIHIVWQKMCGGDTCKYLTFSKVRLNDTGDMETVVQGERVPFNAPMYGTTNTIPWSVQADKFGNTLIPVTAKFSDTKKRITFRVRLANGGWTPIEQVDPDQQINPDMENEMHLFAANAAYKVSSMVDHKGNIRTIVVYNVWTGDPRNEDEDALDQTTQTFYSIREGPVDQPGTWSPPIAASDRVDLNWQTRIHDEGIDKDGIIAFTVQERTSKYNVNTRLFDPAGVKMCLLSANGVDNFKCGLMRDGSGIGMVIPPTESSDGKMHVVNPITKAEML